MHRLLDRRIISALPLALVLPFVPLSRNLRRPIRMHPGQCTPPPARTPHPTHREGVHAAAVPVGTLGCRATSLGPRAAKYNTGVVLLKPNASVYEALVTMLNSRRLVIHRPRPCQHPHTQP